MCGAGIPLLSNKNVNNKNRGKESIRNGLSPTNTYPRIGGESTNWLETTKEKGNRLNTCRYSKLRTTMGKRETWEDQLSRLWWPDFEASEAEATRALKESHLFW